MATLRFATYVQMLQKTFSNIFWTLQEAIFVVMCIELFKLSTWNRWLRYADLCGIQCSSHCRDRRSVVWGPRAELALGEPLRPPILFPLEIFSPILGGCPYPSKFLYPPVAGRVQMNLGMLGLKASQMLDPHKKIYAKKFCKSCRACLAPYNFRNVGPIKKGRPVWLMLPRSLNAYNLVLIHIGIGWTKSENCRLFWCSSRNKYKRSNYYYAYSSW